MPNPSGVWSVFDRTLYQLIRNGVGEARPYAKAWLGIVVVPSLGGVDRYLRSSHEGAASPVCGVLPVVDEGQPFVLDTLGFSAKWKDERAVVLWNNGGEYLARKVLMAYGSEHVVAMRLTGAVIALFHGEAEAAAWASACERRMYAEHCASVASYKGSRS
ncbi:hypothetical protein A2501_03615 [Candidatus Uhrbacteria bacterium RIFOXYC12_FULL_57_11]|nr:MAG: hypothetical protein A2501_03615 [Candidatus Uhrbacteria bacterium RIFOXYC12_FULL_57_11]